MRRLPALMLAALSLAACNRPDPPAPVAPADAPADSSAAPAPTIRTDGTLTFRRDTTALATVRIEIADTDQTRMRGMMGRPPLADDEAMLFVFDRAEPQAFWMANTPSSLDIIYVGADSAVVSIARYAKPFSTDQIPSGGPAQFVVEVRAGWADAKGIQPGDKIAWTRTGVGPMV